MPRPLGQNQRLCLEYLDRSRTWSAGCGWIWNTYSATARILDSLVKRGLAERNVVTIRNAHGLERTRVVYKITNAGRDLAGGPR